MKINMVKLKIEKEDKIENKNYKTNSSTILKDTCKSVHECNMCRKEYTK